MAVKLLEFWCLFLHFPLAAVVAGVYRGTGEEDKDFGNRDKNAVSISTTMDARRFRKTSKKTLENLFFDVVLNTVKPDAKLFVDYHVLEVT